MSWLDDMLGPMSIQDDGDELPQRAALNFKAGLKAADNEGEDRTDISATLADSADQGVVPTLGTANKVLTTDGATMMWAKLDNDNVEAAAAIAGSKINPSFGAQTIRTTGAALLGTLLFDKAFNEEALAAAKSLDITDPHFQNLDGGAAHRNCDLDAEVMMGDMWFLLRNNGGANNIVVRNDTPAILVTLTPSQCAIVICDGTDWSTFGPF